MECQIPHCRLTKKFELGGLSMGFLTLIAVGCVSDSLGFTAEGVGQAQALFIVTCLALAATSGYVKLHLPSFFVWKPKIGKKELSLAFYSSAVCLFVSDVVLRVVMPTVYTSTRYGWTVPANTRSETEVEDSPGEMREIGIEYFDNGFKRWGDVNTEKVKMLIIGDSFTQMNWVSNGEEWYSYLEREFKNLELFVYGGAGRTFPVFSKEGKSQLAAFR